MRISYSKYKAFVDNPERYRLYYALGLTPEGDETPNRMNLGRRRGRCFHAMYENTPRPELVKEYGEELVARCELMRTAVPDLGKLELVETSFDIPIGDGKHSINGRRDHVFFLDGEWRCGDFKSTKGTRTKKELTSYINELETSPQSHFYLRSLRGTGFDTDLFRYHVVLDRKDPKHLPTYIPIDLHVGQAEVDRTMASFRRYHGRVSGSNRHDLRNLKFVKREMKNEIQCIQRTESLDVCDFSSGQKLAGQS